MRSQMHGLVPLLAATWIGLGFAMNHALAVPASLEPRFDPDTGCWIGLVWNEAELIAPGDADIDLNVEGPGLPDSAERKLVALEHDADAGVWRVSQQAGVWTLDWTYAVSGPQLRRRVRIAYHGDEPVKLWNVSLHVPGVRLSAEPDDFYSIPGNYPPERRRFDALRDGRHVREQGWTRGDYALAFLHAPAARRSLSVGYVFTRDEATVHVYESADRVSLAHQFSAVTVMKPGRTIEIGDQLVRVTDGVERDGLRGLDALVESLELGPPPDSPLSMTEGGLYEFHPWGRLEIWPEGDRGMRYPRLAACMPYYRALGMQTLWVLPVSWPPPWVYTLPEFDRIAPENGDPEQLKALVDATHAHDMRMLIDLVVYGINPSSSEIEQLPPEVWCRNEAGEPVLVWGDTVQAADCSNPVWQNRIAEVVAHWRDNFGFDGARLDCIGWGQTLNWANPDRASDPIAYGGLQLNKVIRDGFREGNPHGITLPEGGKPLVFRNADMLFDYPLYLAQRDITGEPDLARWIRQTRDWLQLECIGYPNDGLRGLVRFLQNHDVVEPSDFFGVGLSQALQALNTFIPGIPMVYQEQETGFAHDLARWMALRNAEACFRTGAADFLSMNASHDHVFAFLREADDGAAIVAVNLTSAPLTVDLSWPDALSRRFPRIIDGFTREPAAARVRIAPWRPAVLLLRPEDWTDTFEPPALPAPEAAETSVDVTQEGWLQVDGATGWFVQTAEGLLEGDFNNLGAVASDIGDVLSALPVLERAWNPLVSARFDGASLVSFGLTTPDGVVAVEFDPRRATAACIDDPDVDGDGVRLIVEPPDIATVRRIGPDEPYTPAWRPIERDDLAISPLFVTVRAPRITANAARRQGGGLAGLYIDGDPHNRIADLGRIYSDWGLYDDKTLSSTQWANTPRLDLAEDHPGVGFSAALHASPWNGVQTPPRRNPVVHAIQRYAATDDGLALTVGVRPTVDMPERSAFYAMSFLLDGFEGWRGPDASGAAGDLVGERLGLDAPWLEIDLAGSTLRLDNLDAFQSAFLIDDGDGRVRVFLALLDGEAVDLAQGVEHAAEARLTVTTP